MADKTPEQAYPEGTIMIYIDGEWIDWTAYLDNTNAGYRGLAMITVALGGSVVGALIGFLIAKMIYAKSCGL